MTRVWLFSDSADLVSNQVLHFIHGLRFYAGVWLINRGSIQAVATLRVQNSNARNQTG